ncbi:MFS transporter [Actinomadura fulvescens]|uniref:Major facilitator superfamily (MFS) profile domain-containing protein n=1 Tax=Actinomadura fulvescens TaxID=46160 RepID=A0ABP6C494_9ACTN
MSTGELASGKTPDEVEDRATRRDFRHLWSASLISTLGDGALLAALPLAAAALTSDPRLVAGVAFAGRLPWLVLALFGGVIIDRLDRRRLMMWTQAAQMSLVTLIAVVATLEWSEIWMLYIFAFCIGFGDILFTGASQALVPTIVRPADLEAANGRLVAAESVSREFLGPPIGAALFAFAMPTPFWVDSVTFLASVILIARIRPIPPPVEPPVRRAVFAEIGEGLRFLARAKLPRALTLISAAGNFCEAMALSLLVLFAKEILDVGDFGFGLLLAAMAAGGVLGGLVSGRIVARFGARDVAIAVQVISPAAWLAIGFFGRNAFVVVGLFTVFSIALAMWNVVSMSVRQRLIPNELLGRVTSASRMLAYGATPLGALAGGFVAESYGLVAPWIIGGVLSLVVAVVALPVLRRWDS